jgi:prophage tail gpP-like protein
MFETIEISGVSVPHKSISISISAEEAVRTANGDFVITGPGVPVAPDDEVTLSASGDLLLTGYVRDADPSYDENSRSLAVSFVSKTIDATETSVDHKTGEVTEKNLADIARDYDNLGIGIEDDGDLPVEPRHKLEVGETLFDTIERRARGRGILIHDTPEGKLKLASKPAGTHSGTLKRGITHKSASAKRTGKDRHSDVKVRGQTTTGSKDAQLRAQATATDSAARRKRPLILRHEGEVLTDRMKKRAEWHLRRGAGNALTASITVIGWRDQGDKIWTPNYLVMVDDDWIGINGMMIIKSVVLTQDDGGTTATLSLADPRALGGENPRGDTDKSYAAPTATAEIETE